MSRTFRRYMERFSRYCRRPRLRGTRKGEQAALGELLEHEGRIPDRLRVRALCQGSDRHNPKAAIPSSWADIPISISQWTEREERIVSGYLARHPARSKQAWKALREANPDEYSRIRRCALRKSRLAALDRQRQRRPPFWMRDGYKKRTTP